VSRPDPMRSRRATISRTPSHPMGTSP